jgi:hypothetical protein
MNTTAILAAESRAEQAERRAFERQIELVIVQRRLADVEAIAAKRRDAEATCAVRHLVSCGVIKSSDLFNQHLIKAQFLADPGLILLATVKPYNQKVRKHES